MSDFGWLGDNPELIADQFLSGGVDDDAVDAIYDDLETDTRNEQDGGPSSDNCYCSLITNDTACSLCGHKVLCEVADCSPDRHFPDSDCLCARGNLDLCEVCGHRLNECFSDDCPQSHTNDFRKCDCDLATDLCEECSHSLTHCSGDTCCTTTHQTKGKIPFSPNAKEQSDDFGQPIRHKKRWNLSDDEFLSAGYLAGSEIEFLAESLGRTESATKGRLIKLCFDFNGLTLSPKPELATVNHRMPWLMADEEKLTQEHAAGTSITNMAAVFERTEFAIAYKLVELRLVTPAPLAPANYPHLSVFPHSKSMPEVDEFRGEFSDTKSALRVRFDKNSTIRSQYPASEGSPDESSNKASGEVIQIPDDTGLIDPAVRRGKPWTSEERVILVRSYKAGFPIDRIASLLGRNVQGIYIQLALLAFPEGRSTLSNLEALESAMKVFWPGVAVLSLKEHFQNNATVQEIATHLGYGEVEVAYKLVEMRFADVTRGLTPHERSRVGANVEYLDAKQHYLLGALVAEGKTTFSIALELGVTPIAVVEMLMNLGLIDFQAIDDAILRTRFKEE